MPCLLVLSERAPWGVMMLHWAFRHCNRLWKKGLTESCWELAGKDQDEKAKWGKLCICSRSSARAATYSSKKSKPRYFIYSFWVFSSPCVLECATAGPEIWAPAPPLRSSLWCPSGFSSYVSLLWKTGMQMGGCKNRADLAQALPSQLGNKLSGNGLSPWT